jgi:hypothetical protein
MDPDKEKRKRGVVKAAGEKKKGDESGELCGTTWLVVAAGGCSEDPRFPASKPTRQFQPRPRHMQGLGSNM